MFLCLINKFSSSQIPNLCGNNIAKPRLNASTEQHTALVVITINPIYDLVACEVSFLIQYFQSTIKFVFLNPFF